MDRLYDEELKALAALNRAAGAKAARRALDLFQSGRLPLEVCEMLEAEGLITRSKLYPAECEFHAGREMEEAERRKVRLLSWFDKDYPQALREIDNAPLLLYVRGSLLPQDAASVAVVGSRHPSLYGAAQAERLSRELAQDGVTVVSGLARGIDEAAHRGSLAVPLGRTLAVLGCGVDQVYPREHEKLYAAIAERGAVISEFPFGTGPLAWNFPRRNRIISGLSLGVLVVEAHLRSGSLITARLAAEQGRQVFAVPGPADQWTSRGAHQLLREGAILVENGRDVLEDLQPVFKVSVSSPVPAQPDFPFSETAPAVSREPDSVLALLQKEPLTVDDILSRQPQRRAGDILTELSCLEVEGKISRARDGRLSAGI